VEAVAKKLNSNVTLTYTDKNWTEIIFDSKGHEFSKESLPYTIVETHKDYIVVDQHNNYAPTRVYFEGRSFYVEVKVSDYTYKSYFTKLWRADALATS
jgi:hypothetical protein